jgi:hypothetical protein
MSHQDRLETFKEVLKTGDPVIQRQSIRGLVQFCLNFEKTTNTVHAAQTNIVSTLQSNIKNHSFTVSTSSIDALVKIATAQDTEIVSIHDLITLFTRYSLQCPLPVLPHLTRATVHLFLLDLSQSKAKEPSKKETSPLITLIQNRPETLAELVNITPSLLVHRSFNLSFQRLFRFLSPFFAHVLSSRSLIDSQTTQVEGSSSLATNRIRQQLVTELSRATVLLLRTAPNEALSVLTYLFHFVPTFDLDLVDLTVTGGDGSLIPIITIIDLLIHFDRSGAVDTSAFNRLMLRHLVSLWDEWKHNSLDLVALYVQLSKFFFHHFGKKNGKLFIYEFLPTWTTQLLRSENDAEVDDLQMLICAILDDLLEPITDDQISEFEQLKHSVPGWTKLSYGQFVTSSIRWSIGPLLHILSTANESNQRKATQYLARIQERLSQAHEPTNKPLEQANTNNLLLQHFQTVLAPLFGRGDVSLLDLHYSMLSRMLIDDHLDTEYISNYLSSLNSTLASNTDSLASRFGSTQYLQQLIAFIFISTRSQSLIRTQCLKLIETLCSDKYLPLQFGMFFQPLVLYELSRETDTETKLALLYALPTLGTSHFVTVTPIVRTLNNFLETQPGMSAVIIRLLTDLWIRNDRFFPRLKSTLLSLSQYTTTTKREKKEFDLEVRLAIATSICTVCKQTPSKGLDLFALLSRMIMQDDHPTVLAIAIDAVCELFAAEHLDFYATWYQFLSQPILNRAQSSSIVMRAMCKLLRYGNVPSDAKKIWSEEDEYNLFVDYELENKREARQIMRQLWQCTDHSDESVRVMAFESLATFPLRAHLYCAMTDQEEREEIEAETKKQEDEEESATKDIFTEQEIRRQRLVRLAQMITARFDREKSKQVLDSMQKLMLMVLRSELRKLFGSSATTHSPRVSHGGVINQFTKISEFVNKEYNGGRGSVTQQVTAGAMLWISSQNLSQQTSGKGSQQSIIRAYERQFNDLLVDVAVGSGIEDFFAHTLIAQGFYAFVRRYYWTCVSTQQANTAGKAHDIAFDQIFMKMKSMVNDSTVPSKTENIIHALTGLCLSLPSQAHGSLHIEKVVEWIRSNNALLGGILKKQDDDDIMQQSENVILACNLALACSCIELIHAPVQLRDIVDTLMQQLPVTMQSSIALGIVSRSLCTTNNVDEEDKLEKNMILTMSEKFDAILQDKDLDWRKVMHVIIGRSILCDALLRIGSVDQVKILFEQGTEHLSQNLVTNDETFMSHCLAMPNIALALLHHRLIPVQRIEELLTTYKNILEQTEKSSLPIFTRTYRSACIGMGSLLFGALCESRYLHKKKLTKEVFSLESYNTYVLDIIQRLNDNQNNANVAMGAILSLAAAFGIELIIPEHFSKVDEQDEFQEWGITSRSSNVISSLSSLTHRSVFRTLLTTQDPNDENVVDDNRQKSQLGDLVMRGLQVVKQIFSSSTITDVRVRRYGALVLGVLSDVYNPTASESQPEETIDASNVSGNAERIPLQYLSEDGLSMHMVKILLDANSSLESIETSLQALLATSNLPAIQWTSALQQIMRSTNNIEKAESIRINCIRLLCKEARMGATQSLKLVSSLCEPKHFFALDKSLQREMTTTDTFSLLLSIFPLSRSCVFITDLFEKCDSGFYTEIFLKGLVIAFDASRSLIYTAMDRNVLILFVKHVQKILKQFVRNLPNDVFSIISQERICVSKLPSLDVLSQVLSEIYMFTGIDDHYRRKHERAVQKAQQKQIQVNLGAPVNFLHDTLSLESKNLNNMALCILVQRANMSIIHKHKNLVQGDVGADMSVLKPARELCIDAEANPQVVNLFASMISELLMRKDMDMNNCKKWVQDTLDIVSFLLSESLSQESGSKFQLENALTFMTHNICVWSACDIYLGLFAHDMVLCRQAILTNQQDQFVVFVNNVSRLLVHVLSRTFLESKLSQDVERALLTRLYSFLQTGAVASKKAGSGAESLTFGFVLPLLIHIRGKKLVKKSWVQIGSCLDKTAMRALRHIN